MGSSDTVEEAATVPQQQQPQEEEAAFTLFVAPPSPQSGKKQASVQLDNVSAADTVLSLRQLIAEFPALACYTLALNDFVELGEYEAVDDGATMRMVLDKYDARKVRAHVRRFRDVLSNPPIPQAAAEPEAQREGADSSTVVSTEGEGQAAEEEVDEKKLKEISEQQLKRLREIHQKLEGIEVPVKTDLAEFYAFPAAAPAAHEQPEQTPPAKGKKSDKDQKKKKKKNQPQQQGDANQQQEQDQQQDAKLPSCLKSIVFSGYNPPPGPRKLAGDLLYLEVTTTGDNTRYHVTAHVNGFFVNRSTASKFDPRPHSSAACHAHLLVD
ncbi:hypothetical protein BBJ28_00013872, partial [Nothophytophthora sp. Chile5]